MAQILNPFSYRLNGNKAKGDYNIIEETTGNHPVYRNGDYTIWKVDKRFYNTCWKNIIITQTVGAPCELVDALTTGVPPTDSVSFHHYNRMREAINDGKQYAKEIGFDITNI